MQSGEGADSAVLLMTKVDVIGIFKSELLELGYLCVCTCADAYACVYSHMRIIRYN